MERLNSINIQINSRFGVKVPYQQCVISLMDNIADPDIKFDKKGISNYFYEYQNAVDSQVFKGVDGEYKIEQMLGRIKLRGKGNKYDCILGVSGGVDSTFLAYLAKQFGLRPLLVHFDNGWNSQIAVRNIESLINKLNFDFYTVVIDWEEFKDLQLAYLRASVVDIEAITDHAIISSLYTIASKYNIKSILSGDNVVTEAVLPKSWIWNKTDHRNILDIHRQFGSRPLRTFPIFNTLKKKYYTLINRTETFYPLNYIEYNKENVKSLIKKEVDWYDYGGKHFESIFTRFYQGYILPVKFGIDKRKAHLSNLIFSGQISKPEALKEIDKPIYPSDLLHQDYEFVLKKLDLSESQFYDFLNKPPVPHQQFDYEKSLWESFKVLKVFRPFWRILMGHRLI